MSFRRSARVHVLVLTAAAVLTASAVVASPAGADAPPVVKSNAAAITIPGSGNASPYPSTINVSGVGNKLSKLTVTLTNVSHGCVRDLDILLVGPTGTKTALMSDVGDTAIDIDFPDFQCNNINKTVILDDAGASFGTDIPGGNPITVRPSDNDALGHQGDSWSGVGNEFPAVNLSTFNGTNPNGAWKLYVNDDNGGDSGSIGGGWSMSITTENGAPTATAQVVNVNKGEAEAITLTGTDPDGDPLTCQPTLGNRPKGVVAGSGCNVTYKANTRTSGVDSFPFTVRDSVGQTSVAGSVLVAIQNRAPVADDPVVSVPATQSLVIPLGGTDPDPGEGVALSCNPVTGETTSGKGVVTGSGCNVTYKANADATGEDTFTFSVADGFGGSDTGTVTVNVTPKSLPGCTDADPQNARYVCRVYLDLLGRTAEPAGKTYWVNRLNGGDSRQVISKAFIGTSEFRRTVVDATYLDYLGRKADAAGNTAWSNQLKAGANPDVIRASVLGSGEFYNLAGKSTDGYAAALYQKVVRRPALTDERLSVAAKINGGKSRTTVAAELLKVTEADTVTVAAIYERFLRRSPPPSETTFWVDRLRSGTVEFVLIQQVMASNEYFTKA